MLPDLQRVAGSIPVYRLAPSGPLLNMQDEMQLEKITRMVETKNIVPQIDSRKFDLMQMNDAMRLVHEGHTSGKVMIRFP